MGQQAREFEARGIRLAAVTYDSPAMLAHFATRAGIGFPLLGDAKSEVIRRFGILNTNIPADSPFHGVPFPVTYLLDAQGVVRKKYFEEDYRERLTAGAILTREFPDAAGELVQETTTPHLTLRAKASNAAVWPGSVITLRLEVELKPRMHVYAPEVSGYLPVRWTMPSGAAWLAGKPALPGLAYAKSARYRRDGGGVADHRFAVEREFTVGQANELRAVLGDARNWWWAVSSFTGLRRQGVCYVPQRIPLTFRLPLGELDRQRVPAEVRAGKGPA
ncbi:MAG: redoxin domain-containing protein [Bryobacterales bacterium]|nr:redoxin domain-containing protein [Bryobacterales bacterium]